MKQTIFHKLHISAGAKMGEFAGYDMPLFYKLGVLGEHQHTRKNAGLFDISHMVHIEISGAATCDFMAKLCPIDATAQKIGECKYTFFLNENAGIIDDLIVTKLETQKFLIVANAGCAEKDIAHVKQQAENFDVNVEIIPRAFLALQGPKAQSVLENAGLGVSTLNFMQAKSENDIFISRTGYTGEDGFEIGLGESQAQTFVEKLLAHEHVEWIGLGARDSLRLEAGLSLYGQDLSETITPHEAGLLWAIAKPLREGGKYIGAEKLSEKIKAGRQRMRVGLLPEGRPLRQGVELVLENGESIGEITSGGFGPSVNKPIALGLILVQANQSEIFAELRGKKISLTRAKLPFHPHNYKT